MKYDLSKRELKQLTIIDIICLAQILFVIIYIFDPIGISKNISIWFFLTPMLILFLLMIVLIVYIIKEENKVNIKK